ncbi:MAG TPA: bifunctional [glutamine synthetase] adenylyltransferase/[glutamine synthetase]-adenylyl-L-tyrosine phosphorylase [Acidimicrobiales bacterium]|nr:bifunctional [glutamine synthetase] adenylyltransferase/[glutamine synthetase]-adenylyl-L-tyrosine phosphorylase [Acidimicrobiales bacterium]
MAATSVDEAIERFAPPPVAVAALRQLVDSHAGLEERLSSDARLLEAVTLVTAASRSLTRLLMRDRAAIAVLAELSRAVELEESAAGEAALRTWKQHELLRVAARDLLGLDPLETVVANLSDIAARVLQISCQLACDGTGDGLAVIGMGKLGGRELNYASDIDVMFVGDGDPRGIMEVARQCYRVDANLRPEGRNGPLVRALTSYEAYWDRWAQPWEFQALIKARPVAGDPQLGAAFLEAATERVWGRAFDADDLRQVRAMKARTEEDMARRGVLDREIKRGRGGIRDVEFAVQLLQLVHGRHDPALRSPTTLVALAELGSAGYVDPADASSLDHAYRFLRMVEHRLQLVDEQQVHAVPVDAGARAALARAMGYRDDAEGTALSRLEKDLRGHQATVRPIHERLFFRPLLEAFVGSSPMAPEAVQTRLAAFGFAEAERTRQAMAELTRGLTRTSRLMQQVLPLVLSWLSESPNPDLGLLGLRTLFSSSHRTSELVSTFRESPEAARRLCLLCGTSRILITGFEHHPELITALGRDQAMVPRSREELLGRVRSVLHLRDQVAARRQGLLRMVRAEVVRIAARDVLGQSDVEATAAGLTALAEATLEGALSSLDPPLPVCVLALGRFGGEELAFASDLDVILVYDGTTPEDFAAAQELAHALIALVKGTTPAERVYTLDTGLRPEGKDGPLARSLDSFRAYYGRWAQTWERQALVRARPVAGDAELGRRYMGLLDEVVWDPPFTDDHVRDIRRMKARVERERMPHGEDPQFHLKLGRGSLSDVEWVTQLFQLRHRVPGQGTMAALGRLREEGAINAADTRVLGEAYRFCEQTRNRWYLVKGGPGDALPTRPEDLARLARSCETTPTRLREDYRRVTRRSRQVMERLFYGQS